LNLNLRRYIKAFRWEPRATPMVREVQSAGGVRGVAGGSRAGGKGDARRSSVASMRGGGGYDGEDPGSDEAIIAALIQRLGKVPGCHGVGPGEYCSPRHRIPSNSRKEG